MKKKPEETDFDFEKIPLVVSDSFFSMEQPTDEELSVIAATLHTLFPQERIRIWNYAARLQSLQTRL